LELMKHGGPGEPVLECFFNQKKAVRARLAAVLAAAEVPGGWRGGKYPSGEFRSAQET
jgi:hypothetical protein